MRRFSGRVGAVVVLALCLSVVPVGTASASPWAELGWGSGILAMVELMMVRVWQQIDLALVKSRTGQEALKEGALPDPNGSN